MASRSPLSFWTTVRLLLANARVRAGGRKNRHRELWQRKTEGKGIDWGCLGTVGGFIFMAALQFLFSFGMEGMVRKAHQVGLERDGRLAIDESWLRTVVEAEQGVNAEFSKLVSIQKEIEAEAKLEENLPNVRFEEPAPRDVKVGVCSWHQ